VRRRIGRGRHQFVHKVQLPGQELGCRQRGGGPVKVLVPVNDMGALGVRGSRRRRRIVEDDPSSARYIQTVWGVGYVFVPDGA